MKFQVIISILLALFGATATHAQDLNPNQMTNIIRSLAPTAETSIIAGSPPTVTKRVVVQNTIIIVDLTRSLDFEVYFPFDSAKMTLRARTELEVLGEALMSRALRDHSYLIAGHTDARGSAVYNLDLSSRRALAVRRFLIETFAIEPARLIAVGFGESQLKLPDAPSAGVNRRVEVALILSRE